MKSGSYKPLSNTNSAPGITKTTAQTLASGETPRPIGQRRFVRVIRQFHRGSRVNIWVEGRENYTYGAHVLAYQQWAAGVLTDYPIPFSLVTPVECFGSAQRLFGLVRTTPNNAGTELGAGGSAHSGTPQKPPSPRPPPPGPSRLRVRVRVFPTLRAFPWRGTPRRGAMR